MLLNLIWTRLWRITIPTRSLKITAPLRPDKCTHPITRSHSIESHLTRGVSINDEAARIAARIEMHYTPIHGSWLNMAECELSVLSRQCLARHIPDQETLTAEVEAWEANRNGVDSRCNWQFTTQDAKTKLKHLYPEVEESSALAAQSA